jgi:hypothetical protein
MATFDEENTCVHIDSTVRARVTHNHRCSVNFDGQFLLRQLFKGTII